MKDYHWTSEGHWAVLHSIYKDSQRYTRESIELVIKNITDQRSSYVNETAWKQQLQKYTEGLCYLPAIKPV